MTIFYTRHVYSLQQMPQGSHFLQYHSLSLSLILRLDDHDVKQIRPRRSPSLFLLWWSFPSDNNNDTEGILQPQEFQPWLKIRMMLSLEWTNHLTWHQMISQVMSVTVFASVSLLQFLSLLNDEECLLLSFSSFVSRFHLSSHQFLLRESSPSFFGEWHLLFKRHSRSWFTK